MLAKFVSLREIPYRSLGLVITASAQDAPSRVLILKLFRPLPDVSYQVHNPKRTGTLRMCIDRVRSAHRAALVGHGNGVGLPIISPGIHTPICALGRILPLPFMR